MEDEERRRRPRLVLVDTPGYGFAVGEKAQEQHHSDLLADYTSRSPHLRVAVMLIDSTRGLCAADRRVLRALGRSGVSVLPVLTKVDLVSEAQGGGSVSFAPVDGGFVAANDNPANDNDEAEEASEGSYNF